MRNLFLLLALILSTLLAGGCGKGKQTKNAAISRVLPEAPANESFGGLYPQLKALLSESNPQTEAAVRETVRWAQKHLSRFNDGGCAPFQVVADSEFTQAFGPATLGVTYPWMQIYFRDGVGNTSSSYLWKSASLFVSTVLHEFVHANQRAKQALDLLKEGNNCDGAYQALIRRQGVWNSGFEQLAKGPFLSGNFADSERVLLYGWISPIERAKDEIEASLTTIQWMYDNPETLNAMTFGAVNNWMYAMQYLKHLRILSSTDCFSPDEQVFKEERDIYDRLVPEYVRILDSFKEEVRAFHERNGRSFVDVAPDELMSWAQPAGRVGHQCRLGAPLEIPPLPYGSEE